LRFLQDQEYRPLGSPKSMRADVRIIAASNGELEEAVRAQRFRSDLFYRLNILPLKLPALRERPDDIPTLARHFTAKHAKSSRNSKKELSQAALNKLVSYDWPGNVRELENVIERAMVLSELSVIAAKDVCLPETSVAEPEAPFKTLKARAIAEFE